VIAKPASYSCAPEDWYTNRSYHPANVEIWKRWLRVCRVLKIVPTLDDRPIDPSLVCGPHLNWSLKPTDPFGLLILRYCTTRIAGAIKGRHPAAAMNSDGECIAATWELLRLSLKKAFRLMAKMNFWFFSYPYRGSPYKTYSKNNLLKIMPAWKDLVMKVFQIDGVKTQLCSQGVMRDIEEYFFDGINAEERKLQFQKFFLEHSSNFFSLSPRKLEGPNHPECLLSDLLKKIMANGLQSITTVHDKAYTADQQWVLGDETAVCTAGSEIYSQDASKESFQLALKACAEALERATAASVKFKKQRAQLIEEVRNASDPTVKAAAVRKLTEALRVKSDTQVKRTPAVIGRLLGLCASHLEESIISDMSKTLEIVPILNTTGLMQTLSKKIFESSSNDLGDTSSVEEVTAVLEELVSSPGSDEVSIALANLIKNNKSILMHLPALSTKLLNIHRRSTTTSSLMNTLSSKIYESENNNLDGTSSSVEDVTAELVKLKSSPDNNSEASVAFDKLIKHKPSVLNELPKLAAKLLSMHRGRTTSGTTRSLTNKLCSAIFESSSNDLGDTSSTEDVKAELEKLNLSSSSDNEASVAFDTLVKHKPAVLKELTQLATKLLSLYRGSVTRSLMNTLSSSRVFESIGLNGSSNEEDVKEALERLKSSPDNNSEASVAFDKLIKHKPSVLNELPKLAAKLLSMHRGNGTTKSLTNKLKASKVKAEKAQTQAVNRQVLLSAQWMMEILRNQGYARLKVTAGPKSLGVHMDNNAPIGLLRISQIKSNSQLKDKVIVGDVIFSLDGHFVYHTSHHDMKKMVYDKRENPVRVFEIWRRSK